MQMVAVHLLLLASLINFSKGRNSDAVYIQLNDPQSCLPCASLYYLLGFGSLICLKSAIQFQQATTCPPVSSCPSCPTVPTCPSCPTCPNIEGLQTETATLQTQVATLQQQLTTVQTQLVEFEFCSGISNRQDCENDPRCQFTNNCGPI